uniref:Metastasis-associated protein MTA1 R1 domain-containing protein n=1 Tax=Timema shepardi TaxID=629360 RepID=A0A7R9ASE8_TIMSH|nr:unnamed protein product [Timema shepardi]
MGSLAMERDPTSFNSLSIPVVPTLLVSRERGPKTTGRLSSVHACHPDSHLREKEPEMMGRPPSEFKLKAQLARHYATAHGLAIRSGSPRPIMKTRTAFYLCTTPLTRISRRLCRHLIQPRHAARAPFWPINIPSVKQECTYYINYSQLHMAGKSVLELRELLRYRKKERGSVTHIANRLGQPNLITPEWLILTPKDMMPLPEHVSFPKPPKAPDGTLLYERVPNKPEAEKAALNNISPTLLKRRAYEEVNGMDGLVVPQPGPPAKRAHKDPGPMRAPDSFSAMLGRPVINHLNGKTKIATMTRSGSGRKQVISWMDAPDDVYFRSTDGTKKMRRQLTGTELRRAARKPWRKLNAKCMVDNLLVILD